MPAEVDTPILKNRAIPPNQEARDTMMKPEDLADTVFLCASLPQRTVIEQIVMSPINKRDVSKDLEAARNRTEWWKFLIYLVVDGRHLCYSYL